MNVFVDANFHNNLTRQKGNNFSNTSKMNDTCGRQRHFSVHLKLYFLGNQSIIISFQDHSD